jgi:hypothetical protein
MTEIIDHIDELEERIREIIINDLLNKAKYCSICSISNLKTKWSRYKKYCFECYKKKAHTYYKTEWKEKYYDYEPTGKPKGRPKKIT